VNRWRSRWLGFGSLVALGMVSLTCQRLAGCRAVATPRQLPAPHLPSPVATGHPRLWIRAADLPRLRRWANESNPVFARGLSVVVKQAREAVDAGRMPTAGECAVAGQYCEQAALLLGFSSLVDPDPAARARDAQRARHVLMAMLERTARAEPGDPLADERFSTSDRSRWAGEAFGLTVDFIYPSLSAADKRTIREVFLRWSDQQLEAAITDHNHPEPAGLLDDPRLIADPAARRYALNNYFTAHARNLVLMALALDPADDQPVAGEHHAYPVLRDYLANAVGAWLYMSDAALRRDALGGIAPEGFEYAPRTLGFLLQLYLALETAGEADAGRFGPQVVRSQNPFWRDVVPGFLNSLSPSPVRSARSGEQVYLPAWSGDGEVYELGDFVDVFAPLGLSAQLAGDRRLLESVRWIQQQTPAGGPEAWLRRASAAGGALPYRQAILYFLLFDPDAPPPADPRRGLFPHHFAPGTGRLLARSDWSRDAAFVTFQAGWAGIDHQHGDALDFGLWRGGEWLTKERVGYGYFFETSEQHNTLSVENARPHHTDDDRRRGFWTSGSQWVLSHSSDPVWLAHSIEKDHAYARVDATGMYNSDYEGVSGVRGVSRAWLWLAPSVIVVYDRVRTDSDAAFKRFWLHTPRPASVHGQQGRVVTPGGQSLVVTTLLPESARMTARAYDPSGGWQRRPADGEPMLADLLVEPATSAASCEFLHVLEALDGEQPATTPTLIRGTEPTPFVGAVIGTRAVLFPALDTAPTRIEFTVPASVQTLVVTGLEPNGAYAVEQHVVDHARWVTVRRGGGRRADAGGVLTP
jgi:hypothetical protein